MKKSEKKSKILSIGSGTHKAKKNFVSAAVYPGSFDPITNGHLDILDRALKVFPKITIVVAGNAQKNSLFTIEERVEMIRQVTSDRPGVEVESWPGLIMEYARLRNCNAVIRGLRAASDFEYEFMMASMNKNIAPHIETVFMMTSQDLFFVSSSMLKELYFYGGDVKPYLPPEVVLVLEKKLVRGMERR